LLGQLPCPVVSHCSLDAAYAERPAPDGTLFDQDTARHLAWIAAGPRGAFAPRPASSTVPNKPAVHVLGDAPLLLAPDGQFLARQEAGRRAVGGVSA